MASIELSIVTEDSFAMGFGGIDGFHGREGKTMIRCTLMGIYVAQYDHNV